MGWKWTGIDGKGCANTTYISEFHPHIPKPWFRIICFCIFVYFMCFETPNRVSRVLPWKCLTGVGYIDADWKVSASKIKMNLDLWTESSKIEVQHFLTTKSSISGLWVFDWFWPPCHGNLSLDPPPLVTKVTRMGLGTASYGHVPKRTLQNLRIRVLYLCLLWNFMINYITPILYI